MTKRNPAFPKGRQVEAAALAEVAALLGGQVPARDALVEALHVLNDAFGHLAARHLAALAELMRLSQAEIFETADFYAHFTVSREGDDPPPARRVRVCTGPACRMAGADGLLGEGVEAVPCLGRCDAAPAATITQPGGGFALVDHADAARLAEAVPALPAAIATAVDYALLDACLGGRRSRDEVLATLEASGLRGMGGAGFPTARKWRFVAAQPGPRLMAVNADEGEPGTFKDRHILRSEPHVFLEGMLIAAWAVEAEAIYIYLRDEYPDLRHMLAAEIAALGELARVPIHLRRGAGAYVCGEESAMLESLEGRRGWPRQRPPLVAERGLFGRPTLVNNVETLYWVRQAVLTGRADQRFYSVSGRVARPGVELAPLGITLSELIARRGGMAPGHALRAFLPGGASGGIFPPALADLPLTFGSFEPHGGFIGSAAVIVLSDHDDVRAFAARLMDFLAHESCGQCTPCRVGTTKAAALLRAEIWDEALLAELAEVMRDASICGLGQAAPNVWRTLLAWEARP